MSAYSSYEVIGFEIIGLFERSRYDNPTTTERYGGQIVVAWTYAYDRESAVSDTLHHE